MTTFRVPPSLAGRLRLRLRHGLGFAAGAYREAVGAAAEYAVARAAAQIVGAEVPSTRRRVRALRRHWIPCLETALACVDLAWSDASTRTP
ncbi:V-type ATP synthase subunit D [Streptomyces sp. NBC_00063]|uniref:V-type ATP synthase subunit D n=1 Tax=Streptomyces sp. NBC_00063 TaxID=2975638 RepID=UPI00225B8174|nr:V-type ATP synthase subunit D [Streptomyces sp. NBC_00063]MCX5435304.1 hypothetical protein [Streptomyces sp. NBC_00063]